MSHARVLFVVPDLFFATRIAETCKTLGVSAMPVSVSQIASAVGEAPALLLVDLQTPGVLAEIARLKVGAAQTFHVVGFYPHVEDSIRQAAITAGVDEVMPRSAFTRKLAEIVRGAANGANQPGDSGR